MSAGLRMFGRLLCAALLFAVAAAAGADPVREAAERRADLDALKERIRALQRDIEGTEKSHGSAATALVAAEREVSRLQRRLRQMAGERLEVERTIARLGREQAEVEARIKGGGQEQGRRAGTENLIGIMGFAAAAKAAQNDLNQGIGEKVSQLRDSLMATLESGAEMVTFPGREARRLPNTLSILTPGWRGETQVMQMDLAGFAVSAGSACSSGKVRPSSVLTAMGIAAEWAGDAIRVSIGPATEPRDVMRFADAWLAAHGRWRQRNDWRATAGRV